MFFAFVRQLNHYGTIGIAQSPFEAHDATVEALAVSSVLETVWTFVAAKVF